MKCPNCDSSEIYKNGHRTERQCYKCKHCGRQFLESYRNWKYSDDVKQLCLKMYLNGMGLRGIERVTGIHHTTIIHWIREAGCQIPDAPSSRKSPKLQTLMNSRPLLATSVINFGFGQQLITSNQES